MSHDLPLEKKTLDFRINERVAGKIVEWYSSVSLHISIMSSVPLKHCCLTRTQKLTGLNQYFIINCHSWEESLSSAGWSLSWFSWNSSHLKPQLGWASKTAHSEGCKSMLEVNWRAYTCVSTWLGLLTIWHVGSKRKYTESKHPQKPEAKVPGHEGLCLEVTQHHFCLSLMVKAVPASSQIGKGSKFVLQKSLWVRRHGCIHLWKYNLLQMVISFSQTQLTLWHAWITSPALVSVFSSIE